MILWGLTVKLSWIQILNRHTSLFLGETWENRGLNLRFEAIALQPSFYPRSFVRRGGNCTERMENGQYEIRAMERRSIVADPFWNFRNTIFSMVWHATDNYGAVLWWELEIVVTSDLVMRFGRILYPWKAYWISHMTKSENLVNSSWNNHHKILKKILDILDQTYCRIYMYNNLSRHLIKHIVDIVHVNIVVLQINIVVQF